jgi:hypothetical protein
MEPNIDRSSAAAAADGGGCRLRAQGCPHAATQRTPLAVVVETAKETLAPRMMANIDTPDARKIDGVRLAIVAPVLGHRRAQKRLDRLTWRGKINVHSQWRLSGRVHHLEKIVH